MNYSSFFTQIQDDATLARNGGIILKGKTRNERQPVHMTLLVDTSGSMESEDKLFSVKRSIQLLLDLLSPEDRLSLVTFSDDSKTFLSRAIPTPEQRQAILYRINKLSPEGSTNMSAGLLEARALVEPPSSGRKQGLILLTDGHANSGVYSEQGLIEILQRIQSESAGLSLTTVAYGVDHNAEMLTNMAKAGGGAYNVVTNLEDVATVFGDILGGLVSVSAQKVEVQLPPGSTATTSYRTELNSDGLTTVYVGDLYADGEVTILFKSAPSQGPLRVKGTDMSTLDPIDILTEPCLLTNLQEIPVSLIMAEYRQKVVALLQKLRSSFSSSAMREESEALLKQLQEDDRVKDHPLKAVLLDDIQKTLELSHRDHMTQQETIEMAQHSAYIGMGRGLRSITTHVPPVTPPPRSRATGAPRLRRQVALGSMTPEDPDVISRPSSPHLPPGVVPMMTSPFANRFQTQIATAMRTMSSQPHEDEVPH
jgi:Mg-chelatase subunit ChlD